MRLPTERSSPVVMLQMPRAFVSVIYGGRGYSVGSVALARPAEHRIHCQRREITSGSSFQFFNPSRPRRSTLNHPAPASAKSRNGRPTLHRCCLRSYPIMTTGTPPYPESNPCPEPPLTRHHSPNLCLRRRVDRQIQPDRSARQRPVHSQQDTARTASNHYPSQHRHPRKCHNHHRRHLGASARSNDATQGDSKMQRHPARLLRSL